MKRVFDFTASLAGAIVTLPLVVILVALSTIDTRSAGLFRQTRIGHAGEPFTVLKIRTMYRLSGEQSTVTVSADRRITRFGAVLRRFKLDELPQLWLVVFGTMSLVGPRPDVAGYADLLAGDDRRMLDLRPGITGPASIVFRDEEQLLATFDDPVAANDEVLWPAKVRINLAYLENASLRDDVRLIFLTIKPNPMKILGLLLSWDASLVELEAVRALGNAERK